MQEETNMKNNMERLEDSNLLAIKKLFENIKAIYEKQPISWVIWKEYQINEEKGIAIENYNHSNDIIIYVLKESGLEGKDFIRDHTFFSYKELFKLYPKTSEILLALGEHRIRLHQKIEEELSKIAKEESEITIQAIIQFARS